MTEESNDDELDSGPSNLDCIEPNLWLGNLSAATDLKVLENKKISSILTVDSCPLPKKISDLKNIDIKYIQVTDTPREDLLSHFEDAFEFIELGLKEGVVLVHCYFGVSRSATIMISYIMKKKSMALESAYEFVKSKRRFVGPNPGFMAQLKLYETMKSTIDKNNVQYRMFRLYITADHVKKVKIVPQCCADVIKNDPSLVTVKPNPRVFRCKKCRRIVAQASNIIPHMPKQKYSWRDSRWSEDLDKSEICSQIYFIEPLAWMENVSVSLEGKLHCPNTNCSYKLGSFSWIMGCQCPCGTKVSPGFYLIPSKVDKGSSTKNKKRTKSKPLRRFTKDYICRTRNLGPVFMNQSIRVIFIYST